MCTLEYSKTSAICKGSKKNSNFVNKYEIFTLTITRFSVTRSEILSVLSRQK